MEGAFVQNNKTVLGLLLKTLDNSYHAHIGAGLIKGCDGTFQELGIPQVIVVMNGDIGRLTGAHAQVRGRFHIAARSMKKNGLRRNRATVNNLLRFFLISAVLDHVHGVLRIPLLGDILQGTCEKDRAIFRAYNDGDRGKQSSPRNYIRPAHKARRAEIYRVV